MSTEKRPTSSQLAWLRAISEGAVTTGGVSLSEPLACTWARSTRKTTRILRNAGWIKLGPLRGFAIRVDLTEAGRSTLAVTQAGKGQS